MAEFGSPMTLTTPYGTLTFNAASGDAYHLSDVSGLDMPAVRSVSEPLPQRHGVSVYDSYLGARSISISGQVVPADGAVATRRAMFDTLASYLTSIRRADGTLKWLPSGETASVTNLCTNGSFENNITGWTDDAGGGSTLTRDVTTAKYGLASLKVVTPASGAYKGARYDSFSVTNGQQYTLSLWVKGTGSFQLFANVIGQVAGQTITLTSTWTRYTFTFTANSTTAIANIEIVTPTSQVATLYLDGVQIEPGAAASSLTVETDGGAVTRSGYRYATVRLQVPLTVRGTWLKDFTVGLVAGSAWIYQDTELTRDSGHLSGGTVTMNVTNNGNAAIYPKLRVYGAIANPVITNDTTTKEFWLAYTVAAGQWVEIDTQPGVETIVRDNGLNLADKLNISTATELWTLEPGVNVTRLTGTGPDGVEKLRVVWRDGWA